MIDKVHIVKILNKHFIEICEIQPGIFRASQRFRNRDYAFHYFDLTSNIYKIMLLLKEYQEDLMSDTYFGANYPSDLRWNHYLYFVVDNTDRNNIEFNNCKKCIEADRTYARKIVLTEKEFDSHFISDKKAFFQPPVDLSSHWTERLDDLKLSYILDDEISAPEVVRMIIDGKYADKNITSNRFELTESEKIAGNQFLKSITINGFRKYPTKTHFDFGDVNLIIGRNGAGKTSLLEAIEYLYCGANKRHNESLNDTKIVGKFDNNIVFLMTSSQSKAVDLRARNAKWYAKVDIKKLTLTDSFSKFNFLDTDAAVDLSNNNDSDDRLNKDVARLLLGSEAENKRLRLSRVAEHIGREISNVEKKIDVIQGKIEDHLMRLEDIRNLPQTSDALYDELLNILLSLAWKNKPETKQDAFKISLDLQSAIVAAKKFATLKNQDDITSLKSLSERRKKLERDLEKSKSLAIDINHLQTLLIESNEHISVLRSRQVSVNMLSRYAKTKLVERSENIAQLRDSVDRISYRFAAMGNSLDALDAIRNSESLLKDALLSADNAVDQKSKTVCEITESVIAIEATILEVNVLKQRLISIASEMIAKVVDQDHCPLCRTKFETGQLNLRIFLTNEDDSSKSLMEMHAKLNDAQTQLVSVKNIQTALKALIKFIEPQVEQTVKRALRNVKVLRKVLEQDRQNLQEFEFEIEKYANEGLTMSDLYIHLAKLNLQNLPSESELISIREKCVKKLFKHIKTQESIEMNLRVSLVALIELTGINEVSTKALPEKHVQHLRALLTDLHQLITAAQTLESFIDHNHFDDGLLELRLAQAIEQLTRLVTALQSEKHFAYLSKHEKSNIKQQRYDLNKTKEQLSRIRSARSLLEDLLQPATDDNYAYKMMRDNVNIIKDIFKEIHSPNEFTLQTDNVNALSIYRDIDMNNKIGLRQMSTGQRAAFALSLFLSMNRTLKSGPPIMLLDDPIAHIDDLNILSFLDYLRYIVVRGSRQIFFATADEKLTGLFRQKFQFMGQEKYREIELSRC